MIGRREWENDDDGKDDEQNTHSIIFVCTHLSRWSYFSSSSSSVWPVASLNQRLVHRRSVWRIVPFCRYSARSTFISISVTANRFRKLFYVRRSSMAKLLDSTTNVELLRNCFSSLETEAKPREKRPGVTTWPFTPSSSTERVSIILWKYFTTAKKIELTWRIVPWHYSSPSRNAFAIVSLKHSFRS